MLEPTRAAQQVVWQVVLYQLRVTPQEAREFGVMQIDESRRIIGFEEKVPNPKTIPGDPDHCLASMGIYVFNAPFLFDQLCQDATLPDSAHDFGRNIIPSIINTHKVMAFPFHDENSNDGVDRGLFGIPKEGVGFSRDAKIVFSPPKWADAMFHHDGTAQRTGFRLRYWTGPGSPAEWKARHPGG